jgi:hypothetical protein
MPMFLAKIMVEGYLTIPVQANDGEDAFMVSMNTAVDHLNAFRFDGVIELDELEDF